MTGGRRGVGNRLVVFVKAPRVGAVKTRLARGIGRVAAWRFYRLATQGLLRRVAGDSRWKCMLAVTPDRFASGSSMWPGGLPRLPQGGGDLGARMERPFRHRTPGPVGIVGSDVPGLHARHIAAAFRALRRHDAVFGPARDGGYWLVGLNRRRPVPGIFANVRWSTGDALADTLRNLSRRRVAFLEPLSDVDTVEDYAAWLTGAGSRRS